MTNERLPMFAQPSVVGFFDGDESMTRRGLEIIVRPCKTGCLSDEEIQNFKGRFNQEYFGIWSNKRTFSPEVYDEESIVKNELEQQSFFFNDEQNEFNFKLKEYYLESTQSKLGNFFPPVEQTWFNVEYVSSSVT